MAFTARIVGRRFGSVTQPKDKFSEDAKGGQVISRTYRTLWAGWLLDAPSRGSKHPDYPLAKLETREAEQIEPGWLCDVTLSYVVPPPDETEPEEPDQLPIPRYTQSESAIEIPIEAHPNFSSFGTEANGAIFGADGDFKGWKATSAYAGFLSYKVGSVTESITTYFWSRPSGVEGFVGSVSGNWLTVSGSIQREGIYWSRTINRLYSERGWPSAIYPGT